jgi:putative oxidoreductase
VAFCSLNPVRTEVHNADASARFFAPPLLGYPRILVGWVFLPEDIQKFLFPAALGTGRFAKIGIPWPQFSAPFQVVVEIVCGILLLLGLFTSLASIFLLIEIAVAIVTTKFPMLFKQGLWATPHEARRDSSMFFGLIAFLTIGGGYILSGLP